MYITRDLKKSGNICFWGEQPTLYKGSWEGKKLMDMRSRKVVLMFLGPSFLPEPEAMLVHEDAYEIQKKLGVPFMSYRKGETVKPLAEPF